MMRANTFTAVWLKYCEMYLTERNARYSSTHTSRITSATRL